MKFQDYNVCLEANQLEKEIQYLEKISLIEIAL